MITIASLVVLSALFIAPAGDDLVKGKILDKVECRKDPAQSYALYVPTGYDPAKKWPILYAFDPGGRGREPLICFQDAADALGFIIACSNNSRNGPWGPIFAAGSAIWEDTHERLAVDDERIFVTGFSGGARAASIFSKMVGRPVAGIVACGAGLAVGGKVDDLETAAFCGIVGTADFNTREMLDLDKLLDRRPDIPHWIRTFDGGHAWPLSPVCSESMEWLELVSARRKGLSPERPLADALMAKITARASALEAEGGAFRAVAELTAAASALAGIGDTGGLLAQAARLKRTGEYKKYARKEADRIYNEDGVMVELFRILGSIEKTVVLRRDLAGLFARIDRLSPDAKSAPEASDRDYARRVLQNIANHAGNRGAEFLASNAPANAVLCYEIAVRAGGFDPNRCRWMLYNLACAHARCGNVREALDSLRWAVENGFADRDQLLSDKDFDAIRNSPEFQEILAAVR
jgi:hypothetical protein